MEDYDEINEVVGYPDNMNKFTDSRDILNYIHGGKGILLLEAPSGNSHTYYFSKPNNENDFPEGILFVYTKGHDGKRMYVGMVDDENFRLTSHSKFIWDSDIVRGARYILCMAHSQELVDKTPMSLYHMGICCRCGRILTTKESIKSGIGPKCKKMMSDMLIKNQLQCWD